jgi:hypothetical protein
VLYEVHCVVVDVVIKLLLTSAAVYLLQVLLDVGDFIAENFLHLWHKDYRFSLRGHDREHANTNKFGPHQEDSLPHSAAKNISIANCSGRSYHKVKRSQVYFHIPKVLIHTHVSKILFLLRQPAVDTTNLLIWGLITIRVFLGHVVRKCVIIFTYENPTAG